MLRCNLKLFHNASFAKIAHAGRKTESAPYAIRGKNTSHANGSGSMKYSASQSFSRWLDRSRRDHRRLSVFPPTSVSHSSDGLLALRPENEKVVRANCSDLLCQYSVFGLMAEKKHLPSTYSFLRKQKQNMDREAVKPRWRAVRLQFLFMMERDRLQRRRVGIASPNLVIECEKLHIRVQFYMLNCPNTFGIK
jgi:hypothetical protein